MADPAITLKVRVGNSQPVDVKVHAVDVPGPSGYEMWTFDRLEETKQDDAEELLRELDLSLPDLDAPVLVSPETLRSFLRRLVKGATKSSIDVMCLTPRLEKVRERLGASPNAAVIDVDLPEDG